jgi:hypothetical protein
LSIYDSRTLQVQLEYFTIVLIETHRQSKNRQRLSFHVVIMLPVILDIWGCMPELSKNCIDMTNASSTYLGIAGGAVIGLLVSWWIYHRQKYTTAKQDHILRRIKDLEEKHTNILKKLEDFDDKHEHSFDSVQELNEKIDSLLKRSEDSSK